MILKTPLFTGLLAFSLLNVSGQVAAKDLKTEKEKLGYAVGMQIGSNLKRDGLDVDVDAMTQAIKDVLGNKKQRLSNEEIQKVITAYQQKQQGELAKKSEVAKKAGDEFLAANKSKQGVVTLPSGMQYKILTEGKGKKPASTDTIVAHYRGTLINGKEFDSSYARGEPATFGVNQVIKGWQEILPMMPTGSKWQVFIPSDLAYGPRGAGGNIGPNETLIFEIELLEIKQ